MSDKTEKKPAKKATKKNTGETWDLQLRAPGVVSKEGIIVANTPKAIILNARRDGSSLRQKLSINKDKIIFVKGGSLSEGTEVVIMYRDIKAPIARKMTKVVIGDGYDKDTGMLKGQLEKGESCLINSEYADLITRKDAVVEAPAGVSVKKKKSVKK